MENFVLSRMVVSAEMVILVKKDRENWLADSKIVERTGCTGMLAACIVSNCWGKDAWNCIMIYSHSIPQHSQMWIHHLSLECSVYRSLSA